ncbi:MAG: phosphoglucosamine mutase [Thermoplasmata archaeon]|nr:phosphoglucosamine mutase [Thermoplasmata archaeon]
MRLFGTNGIREVVGTKLTAPFIARVAGGITTVLTPGDLVTIGWDARTSSPEIAHIVSSTLALAGHRVAELGILPTPAVQYLVPRLGAQLGIIATASHNPREFNGLKCIAADGLEVPRSVEEAIEVAAEAGTVRAVPYDGVGSVYPVTDGANRYVEGIVQQVDAARIRRRKLTVVLDCGNGASVTTGPTLLRRLGCRVITLNGHPDGTFPGHLSEPTEANIQDLIRAVPAVGADLGIAHDGDADRAVFVDATGRFVPGEETLALLARDAVERAGGGIVVSPVSASQSLEDAVRPHGGTVVYTRVGSPAVTHEMQTQKAVFGGEENGGLIFPKFQYARDGGMSAAGVLDLLARLDVSLAEALRTVPRYALVREKVPCPVESRGPVMAQVQAILADGAERVVTLDGIKAFRDGGWILLRPSGTEPLLRIFAESKDPARARALADEGLSAVRRALAELPSNP